MLAKKTSKNQLTLPKEIVKAFPDVEYFEINIQDGKILLTPVKITPASTLQQVKDKIEKLGLTEKDIDDAIKWARREEP
ncbi:MAG: AbrB/MazE/SpoVT family DNA-binding domain-containing protein [Deltaproteobacteria bacterium]|nr:MAG: AbrB/MazE/SpoVT family DNA-binding domain-containing protein [Deltaproteobacteria bacterium]